MTLELLSKSQLQIINRNNLRYPLDAAEKDYLLALIAYTKEISEEKILEPIKSIGHFEIRKAQ